MHASHSTPGQQLLEKLQSVSPVELDGEVVVLSFMFVFPAALYYAGRVLIWDYKVGTTCRPVLFLDCSTPKVAVQRAAGTARIPSSLALAPMDCWQACVGATGVLGLRAAHCQQNFHVHSVRALLRTAEQPKQSSQSLCAAEPAKPAREADLGGP